jgi:hypothetical protein
MSEERRDDEHELAVSAFVDQQMAVHRELAAYNINALRMVPPDDRLRPKRDHVLSLHRSIFSTIEPSDDACFMVRDDADWARYIDDPQALMDIELPRVVLAWRPEYELLALAPTRLDTLVPNIPLELDLECNWHNGPYRDIDDAVGRRILPLVNGVWLVLMNLCGSCVERVGLRYGISPSEWLHPADMARPEEGE